MCRITIRDGDRTAELTAPSGSRISAILQRSGLPFSMPCGGGHTCGKCRVRMTGAVSAVTPDEAAFLTEGDLAAGIRLACFARAEGDCGIVLEPASPGAILSETGGRAFAVDPDQSGLGVAIDIGTTTVVVYLYRLSDGTLLGVRSALNAQRSFGADVISRIGACAEGGVGPLRRAIVGQLDEMIAAVVAAAGERGEDVRKVVAAGNTTMLHLLTGLDPQGIAVAPFTPASLFGNTLEPGFFGSAPAAEVVLPGCVSAYVGADITCAAVASGMLDEDVSLLIDLGTNGEMALKYHGELVCCSTAAGPAFEGAGMQMGMAAADGAISRVSLCEGNVLYNVIGGGKPLGICGSGIIDAVSVFLRLGLIDETGRIDDENRYFSRYGTSFDGRPALLVGESGIVVTQQDVRRLQLAKAAVAAGIETMLVRTGCTADEIGALYLAGGFGTFVDRDAAAAIGLIPDSLREKVKAIGNGAGTGASMLLLSGKAGREAEKFLAKARELNLSADPVFTERYIEKMAF